MECHVDGDKKVCLIIGREKCKALWDPEMTEDADASLFLSDDSSYFYCMEDVFEGQFGEGNVEFCRYAFGVETDVLTPEEWYDNLLEE